MAKIKDLMTCVEILEHAWRKIDSSEKWCKNHYGMTSDGRVKFPDLRDAVKLSAKGAILCARQENGEDIHYFPTDVTDQGYCAYRFLLSAANFLYGCGIDQVNDVLGYYAVKDIYDLAIRGAHLSRALEGTFFS